MCHTPRRAQRAQSGEIGSDRRAVLDIDAEGKLAHAPCIFNGSEAVRDDKPVGILAHHIPPVGNGGQRAFIGRRQVLKRQ